MQAKLLDNDAVRTHSTIQPFKGGCLLLVWSQSHVKLIRTSFLEPEVVNHSSTRGEQNHQSQEIMASLNLDKEKHLHNDFTNFYV